MLTLAVIAQLPVDATVETVAKMLLDAILAGRWFIVPPLAVAVLVILLGTYGSKFIPFLATGPGKALLALALGIFGGAATELAAASTFTWKTFLHGAQVGVLAAGGYSLVKALWTEWLWPIIKIKVFPPPPPATTTPPPAP
jgi:hypothetical protein